MEFTTCSQVISLARELETGAAEFYQKLAHKFPKHEVLFLSLASENKKNTVAVERAYCGVITDALEGCFAFCLDPSKYIIKTEVPAKASDVEAVKQAISIEETMIRFYQDAAEQGKALMADVPRSFILVAKKRAQRLPTLKELLS
jgi:hypothetical protein